MKRTHVVAAALAVLVVALGVWLLFVRDGGNRRRVVANDGSGRGAAALGAARGPRGPGRQEIEAAAQRAGATADPFGKLLLEGQVLGDDDQPVGGAEVWISTAPPRSVRTEPDGGFSFDKLLPREYSLTAHADDATGGPVRVRMGPTVEPVVIRLREGATLKVRVTSESNGAPLAGATVDVKELGSPTRTTGADGIATFKGLGNGWSVVTARASGFATSSTIATVGGPGTTQEISIVLRQGAALAGRVVDETGKPVAGAYVTLGEASSMFGLDADATTSADDGTWRFATVAAGSYTVAARDGEHAPGVSEILSLDGQNAREGVEIELRTAAVVRGRVITRQREPAGYASVQVAPKDMGNGAAWWGLGQGGRRVTADEQGGFEIRGLPREKVRLRAENDVAASAITDVDLLGSPQVDGIELMLDVEGTIAGVVVDSKGEPVPEAQVSAFPDVFGSDSSELDNLAFGGLTAAMTDGGGGFRIHGLPEGGYRLWASRTGATMMMWATQEGTKARTGDTGVKIVLPAPGGIEGKVAFADGTPPARAVVQVGMMPAGPTQAGDFEVRDLPPGRYDLHVRGPDFAELVKRDIEVKAGATTDLGTLTVKRGRKIVGVVVDAPGRPVAGARVVAGEILFSEGKGGEGNQMMQDQLGIRHATTDASGTFIVQGAPEKGGSVMAEHASLGRSDSIRIAPGEQDVTGVALQLRGFGSVAGKVTAQGQPVGSVQVIASAKASTGHMVAVATGPDGSYVIEKLPEGDHRISANRMVNFQMSSTSRDVHVTAGQRTTADLDIPVGAITLTVKVQGEGGKKIDDAQLFLFRGAVAASNARELMDRALAGDMAGMVRFTGTKLIGKFDKLLAGGYTVCVLPINGNMQDPTFLLRLNDNVQVLAVYCKQVTVAESPPAQTFVATVPPMSPLPAN